MKLDQTKIERFKAFMERIKEDTYPEPLLEQHVSITERMIGFLLNKYPLLKNSKILDVGCGQGVAMEHFKVRGFSPVGITLNEEDLLVCRQKGHKVYEMDQSFLDFNEEEFDLVWCRHCLEHSIFPYFTLCELFRVLKHKGFLYIEVPAPDTSCKHETNKNHYSVLGKSMWIELIKRAGFNILDTQYVSFDANSGPDTYWMFIQQKP